MYGAWFLCDELNLAPAAVVGQLVPVLDRSSSVAVPGKDESISIHSRFQFFATQNPPSYQGRSRLPSSLMDRFVVVNVPDYQQGEVQKIIQGRRDDTVDGCSEMEEGFIREYIKLFDDVYQKLHEEPALRLTLREGIKTLRRIRCLPEDLKTFDTAQQVLGLYLSARVQGTTVL